jgi:putative ABC transport system permease protein
MKISDHWHFSWHALIRHGLRSAMLLLAVTIGVASVLLLTSIGEGARIFIEQEFSSLGTRMLVVLPGRKETTGGSPPIYGTTPRDLTLEDAQALRRIDSIEALAPIIAGTASVSYQSLSRDVIIVGSTPDMFEVRNLTLARGKMLPQSSAELAVPVCILGSKLAKELFLNTSPVGRWLRIGEYRYRIIGVLKQRGESLGLDFRDMAIIPVRSAEMLFNSPGLFRILIQLSKTANEIKTSEAIENIIAQRHDGEADVTVISQDSILGAFNKIILAVTVSIGGIAAISLFVAGILIMNVSYISVSQRTKEIGLLKSIGASAGEIHRIFLVESLLLVSLGTLIGIAFSYMLVAIAHISFSDFPIAIPWWSTLSASITALMVGLLFSWLPSSKAAAVDPILALRD